ncbi:MAG: hypothetical protein ACREFB_00205 [Stellaceae bacterium]
MQFATQRATRAARPGPMKFAWTPARPGRITKTQVAAGEPRTMSTEIKTGADQIRALAATRWCRR